MLLTLSALAALTAIADLPAPPETLKPAGPWNVEYAESACLLSRPFGDPKNQVVVAFQPLFNSGRMDVVVIYPNARIPVERGEATIQTLPDGKTFDGSYYAVRLKDGLRTLVRISASAAVYRGLPTTTALRITAKLLDIVIAPTAAAKAMVPFRQCENDLLKAWGVDPATQLPDHGPKLRSNLGIIFGHDSYAMDAVRAGVQGRVTIALNVSEGGRVTNCRVILSSADMLNAATCEAAKRLTFDPATDANETPIKSLYVLPVNWQLGL